LSLKHDGYRAVRVRREWQMRIGIAKGERVRTIRPLVVALPSELRVKNGILLAKETLAKRK